MTAVRAPVLITGLSGSGKSGAVKAFEDLGFYCVDNLPLPLLEDLLADPREVLGDASMPLAVVTDSRTPDFVAGLPALLDRLPVAPKVVFLEASDEVLVRRFSETRRRHPLAIDQPLIDSIHQERDLLAELRGRADLVFDTSEWTIHDLRRQIQREFKLGDTDEQTMMVSVMSFGFKHGLPYGADSVFDVRFLPNPHFQPELRPKTGREPEIVEFLEAHDDYRDWLARLFEFVEYLLPRYRREARSHLTLAVGCTGGRHRSVAVAEALAARLREDGWRVHLQHRDEQLERGS